MGGYCGECLLCYTIGICDGVVLTIRIRFSRLLSPGCDLNLGIAPGSSPPSPTPADLLATQTMLPRKEIPALEDRKPLCVGEPTHIIIMWDLNGGTCISVKMEGDEHSVKVFRP